MRFTHIFLIVSLLFIWIGCGQQTHEKPVSDTESGETTVEHTTEQKQEEPPPPDIAIDSREDALGAMNHEDIRVRWQAVNMLKSNPDTAFEDLKKAMDSDYEDVASAAVSAIRLTTTAEKAIPVLVDALDHQFSTAQAEAVIGLGAIGPAAKEAVSSIETRMEDADERFREKAAEALTLINS